MNLRAKLSIAGEPINTGGGGASSWNEIENKPFSIVDTENGLTIQDDTLMIDTLDHIATIDYVDQQIDSIDLSDYATQTELQQVADSIPTDYVDTTTFNTLQGQVDQAEQDIADIQTDFATKQELADSIPTDVSELNNDAGYVTYSEAQQTIAALPDNSTIRWNSNNKLETVIGGGYETVTISGNKNLANNADELKELLIKLVPGQTIQFREGSTVAQMEDYEGTSFLGEIETASYSWYTSNKVYAIGFIYDGGTSATLTGLAYCPETESFYRPNYNSNWLYWSKYSTTMTYPLWSFSSDLQVYDKAKSEFFNIDNATIKQNSDGVLYVDGNNISSSLIQYGNTNKNSVKIFDANATATGTNSIVLGSTRAGYHPRATGENSMYLGYADNSANVAVGTKSFIVGSGQTKGVKAFNVGHSNYGNEEGTFAIGHDNFGPFQPNNLPKYQGAFGYQLVPYASSYSRPVILRGYKNKYYSGLTSTIDYLDILGNGHSSNYGDSDNTFSTAEATDWSGNKYLAGDIYTNVTDWSDPQNNSIKLANISACPTTTAGTFSLQATVDSNGNVTYSWV